MNLRARRHGHRGLRFEIEARGPPHRFAVSLLVPPRQTGLRASFRLAARSTRLSTRRRQSRAMRMSDFCHPRDVRVPALRSFPASRAWRLRRPLTFGSQKHGRGISWFTPLESLRRTILQHDSRGTNFRSRRGRCFPAVLRGSSTSDISSRLGRRPPVSALRPRLGSVPPSRSPPRPARERGTLECDPRMPSNQPGPSVGARERVSAPTRPPPFWDDDAPGDALTSPWALVDLAPLRTRCRRSTWLHPMRPDRNRETPS